MPRIKFDTKKLTALPHPNTGQVDYFDTLRPAFGLRVGKVRKTFFLMARIDGKQTRIKLGTFGNGANDLSLKQARGMAGDYIALIDEGGDPRVKRSAKKDAVVSDRLATFGATFERYLAEGKHKDRTRKEIRTAIHNAFLFDDKWASIPISDITGETIMRTVDGILDKGRGYHANRVYSYLSSFFKWATKTPADRTRKAGGAKILQQNPLADYSKPFDKERSRDRVLSPDELRKIVTTCYGNPITGTHPSVSWPFGPLVMLLILTGARRSEISGLRWSELDLENKLWHLPAARAKNGADHTLPLSDFALDIISKLPRINESDLIFTTTGKTCVSGHSLAKRRIDETSGVDGWRFHDLRRTMTSYLAALGVDMDTASKLITHGKLSGGSATLAVYQRHKYAVEMRVATGLFSAFIILLLHGFDEKTAIGILGHFRGDNAMDAEPFTKALGTLCAQNAAWRSLFELLIGSRWVTGMIEHAILQVLHPVEVKEWAEEMSDLINASRTIDKEKAIIVIDQITK